MSSLRMFAQHLAFLLPAGLAWAAAAPADLSKLRPGPIHVETRDDQLIAAWNDRAGVAWSAAFSLDPEKRLIASIRAGEKEILADATPLYFAETGKRRKGWNAFFDYPPSHPEGTRHWMMDFQLTAAKAATVGDRVQLTFEGLKLGIFEGALVYTIFPNSRLIQQEAVVSTDEPDTAFYYDAGIEFAAEYDVTSGRNMSTEFAWYDTEGALKKHVENGLQPERIPREVRYRTLAVKTENGSVAVFPAPHQYFFPRDFTSNLAYLWQRARRGRASLGIRQLRDENWQFYPWSNAPPGTNQRLSLFLLLSTGEPADTLDEVLRYTNRDRFPALDGYKTLSAHWHLAYTVQAMDHGMNWTPPFKPVLKEMGVDASIIMDFHGDGHPRDLGETRLRELAAFFEACRTQSEKDFLLIPSEEANVHFEGHWSLIFPKPVYWFMDRPAGGKFEMKHPEYGKVYSVADKNELLDLVHKEKGWMYQTHPRTKGSTGYPDKIRDEEYFTDPAYFGAGWKAMPSDPSSPRLGDRTLTLLNDMSNWGLQKKALGEVDVFQFDHTHELYAHMNINYVKAAALPDFENYDRILDPLLEGDFFVSTGEVLLPRVKISTGDPNRIAVEADLRWTLPLRQAEIVWGDGKETYHHRISLEAEGEFGEKTFQWSAPAPGWKWARLAVWDVAADGAFVNPTWNP